MPLFYACNYEEQAKELCSAMHGEYKGRSAPFYNAHYTWQTHTGRCVTSFARSNGGGYDRYMVVFNDNAEAFETVPLDGVSAARTFLTGGIEDASRELLVRYHQYCYVMDVAKQQTIVITRQKAKSVDNSRLRRIKGRSVVVTGGTTITHGTTGVVFWVGHGDKGDARVGFKSSGGEKHFISLRYVIEENDLPLLAQAS